MDMQQPPEPPAIHFYTTTDQNVVRFPTPREVLRITPEGQVQRNGVPLEELSKDELLVVVREMIDLVRKGHSR